MSRTFSLGRVATALLGLWLILGLALAGPADAEKYVVLGDSYSAGNGSSVYDFDSDQNCLRSTKAYGPLIKADLGAGSSFRFVACSGAVASNITSTTQGSNPVQQTALGADTLDVTFSIGGNDAGFSDVLVRCGLPLVNCDGDIDDAQNFINGELSTRLNNAYSRIRQAAPNARVGVVGYPRLFPANGDDCSAATFFSAGEIARLNQTADLLADVTRERARAHGFSFIDSRPAFLGHAWCEDEWINGLSNPTNKSFHPNDRGYVGFAGIARATHLAAPQPAFSRGPNGRIAFSSDRDGNREVYVINGNGSFPVNLTAHSSDDRDPVFSPDGSEIAFASNRDGDFEIYKMPSAGGPVTKLTSNNSSDTQPSWSPNGRQLVFRSNRDGNDEIYKMAADGSGQIRLTQNSAADQSPSFSPDGSEIVFERFTAGNAVGQGREIFKMSSDGQGQINLTNNSVAIEDGGPEWSPDGSRIAFHSNRAGNAEIYTMTATGGSATRLTNNGAEDLNPSWSPNGSHITFESDRDGSPQIYTMAASGSGEARRTNGSADELSPSWQGDSRPPQTTIDTAPAAISNNPVAAFTFSSDEPGSTFECSLDGAEFESCLTPYSTPPLEDGAHTFAVRSRDPSGNLDPAPQTSTFSVDTAGKLTSITSGASGQTNDNQLEFTFLSEDEEVTFECRLFSLQDSAPAWEECESPFLPGELADGSYRFEVRGTDGVGNIEDPPQRREFTLDTQAPVSTVSFAPAPIGVNKRPVFEFAADEPGARFECRLVGATDENWGPCESPWSAGTLDDGQYRFELRATDLAGNTELTIKEFVFGIDTQAPSTSITSGPGAEEPSADVSFQFAADEPGVRFECRLDSFDDIAWSACTSPRGFHGLNHGRHSFQVRAIDQAGNVEGSPPTSEFGVRTDPGLTITSAPSQLSSNTDPSITFLAEDPDMDFECRFDSTEWEPCSSPFRPGAEQPLDQGEHRFELRGVDWFGTQTVLPARTWTVVTGSPQPVLLSSPRTLDNSRTAQFEIDGGWGSDQVQCQIDGLAWQPCESDAPVGKRIQTVTYNGLHDGNHRFRVRASNSLFGMGPEVIFDWKIDATPPEVKIDQAPPRIGNSPQVTWRFSGSESDGSFRCRVDGSPPQGRDPIGTDGFGSCTSPLTVEVQDGEHRFEVIAVDQAGNLSPIASRLWSVDTTGPTTRITAGPEPETTSRMASFSFDAEEASAGFSCRLDGSAWRPCRSGAEYDGLSLGSHRFEVHATDSLGNQGEVTEYRWLIKAANSAAPSINFKRKIRLGRSGRAVVAVARCPVSATCRISTPARIRIKLKGSRVTAKVVNPGQVAAGRQAKVSVVVPRRKLKAFKGRPGSFRLVVKATAEPGTSRNAAGRIQVRR